MTIEAADLKQLGTMMQTLLDEKLGHTPTPAAAGWAGLTPAQPSATVAGIPQPKAVFVPLKIVNQTGASVRVYVEFGPEVLSNLEAFLAAFGAVAPLDVYTPRQNGFGGQGNGWSGTGSGWRGGRRW